MKFSHLIKYSNNFLTINNFLFYLLLVLIPTLILSIIDYRYVINDGEPDYLANGYAIHKFLIPLNSHHPGTATYYLYSFLLSILEIFKLSLTQTIIVLRFIFILLGLSIIYVLYINNKNVLKILLIIFLSIPYIRWVYAHIGPEPILIPLIFILIHQINFKNKIIIASFLLGILLNIKFSILLIYPLIIMMMIVNHYNLISILKLIIYSSLIFILFSVPVLPNLILPINRSYEEIYFIYNLFISNIPIVKDYSLIVPIIILLMSIFLINFYIKFKNKNYLNKLTYNLILISYLILFIFLIFFKDGSLSRHLMPIIPFICIYLSNLNYIKKTYINIFTLICLIFVIFYNFNSLKIPNSKLLIDDYISKNNTKLYFHQESQFNSEYLFLTWGQYRYAKSHDIWPERWASQIINIEYLNIRSTNCEIKNLNHSLLFQRYEFNYEKCFEDQVNDILHNDHSVILYNNTNNDKLINSFNNKNLILIKFREINDFTEYKLKKL